LLVTVDEPRRNSADVRAGTNEQEYDEEERLEIEERGLKQCSGTQSVACHVQIEVTRKERTMVLLELVFVADGVARATSKQAPVARTERNKPTSHVALMEFADSAPRLPCSSLIPVHGHILVGKK
jgi:hypothetical protein